MKISKKGEKLVTECILANVDFFLKRNSTAITEKMREETTNLKNYIARLENALDQKDDEQLD